MIKTAVVILNWNGIAFLQKFLGTVVRYSLSEETEVYVADNGSADGSAEWIASMFSNVNIIRMEKNHGFAGGYNMALKQIDAKYYILINSDIEVTEGWLTPLIRFMEDNPSFAACQPKILSWAARDHFEYAGAAGGFIDRYGYPFCRGRVFNVTEKDLGQYDNQSDIFWSSGACMAIRAEAWTRCGGFDTDFFAHMEEIDLCWRLHKMGYRISFVPGSIVYHVGGGSLSYESSFKVYLNFRNSLFMLYKNLPDKGFRRVLFIRKVLDGLAAVLFLLRGRPGHFRAVWKAHLSYYRSIGDLKLKRKATDRTLTDIFSSPEMNRSIVFEFYIKGHKTYSAITEKH